MSNITQVVNVEKNMTSFKKGVHTTDIDQLLSSTGPFTVFAPSDLAFSKLEAGTLENLLRPENKISLISLINHHIVQGKINFSDLKDGSTLRSLNGKSLYIKIVDGKVTVDNATITTHDVKTTNGVIHTLDAVL